MKRIPLSATRQEPLAFALVDDEDYDALVAMGAWSLSSTGYAARGRSYTFMHRLLLGLERGDGKHSDHINRNRLDNQRANLRVVTHAENMQNRHGWGGASSRFRGVTLAASGKWVAGAWLNGRNVNLGRFATEVEAAVVAEAFRREHMPFATPDPELAAYMDLAA